MHEYYVYIMSSYSYVLYTGITNDLERRVYEHKNKMIDGFTKKYNINCLVYFESTNDVAAAIQREKEIKGMDSKKENGVNTGNESRLERFKRRLVR